MPNRLETLEDRVCSPNPDTCDRRQLLDALNAAKSLGLIQAIAHGSEVVQRAQLKSVQKVMQ